MHRPTATPTSEERPRLSASGAEFSYRRRRNAGQVSVLVETSTDLQVWNSVGIGQRIGEADAITDVYSIALPSAAPQVFARLRVTVD